MHSSGQASLPHDCVCMRACCGQWPPPSASFASSLERLCWPPPQETLQDSQACHSLSWQSIRAAPMQAVGAASPIAGLQGAVCLRSPTQAVPLPLAVATMRRERLMMPSHVLLQSLHKPQSESSQSTSLTHGTPALQLAYIRESPTAGFPHSFASARILRARHVRPPSQVLSQGSHSSHSSHWPSMHALAWQACVLQGSVSSLFQAVQDLPPFWGAWMMWRSRVRMPPSQLLLQLLQSDQRPHTQSTVGHAASGLPWASLHSLVSFSPKLQPMPPSEGSCVTARERACCPVPQLAVQAPHACQSLTAQSCLLQGSALQPSISIRLSLHCSPPASGFCVTWRCLKRWPPPHDLSHSSHTVHSETSHFVPPVLQEDNSFSVPLQAFPPFSGSRSTFRSRDLVPSWALVQPVHASHSPMTHSAVVVAQENSLHIWSSWSLPSHMAPPFSAGSWTALSRVCRPPPQLIEQVPHSDQRLNWHERMSAGASLQDAVSSRLPTHSFPPLDASCAKERLR
mmetsp:Transcript_11882/g.32497  ORF Transcript_11882/g.32497 Transcript_11882/m.32497 type:complete len:512 (-) Transcript_11882:2583-4118(-)